MSSRIIALDSLRGLASFSIIISHYVTAFGVSTSLWGDTFAQGLVLFWHGSSSLSMFFVLSGFVLAHKYDMGSGLAGHAPFSLGSFYIARISRILPTFLCILLISLICHHFLRTDYQTFPPQSDWLKNLWAESYRPIDLAKEAILKPGFGLKTLVPQGWTLRVTVKLTLFLPFMIILASRSTAWLIMFCVVGMASFKMEVFTYHFLLGILIAKHQVQIADLFKRHRMLVLSAGLLMGIAFYFVHHIAGAQHKALRWCACGTYDALIIIGALNIPWFQRVLSSRLLRFAGRVSYSAYLLHVLVLMVMIPPLLHALNAAGVQNEHVLRAVILIALCGITYLLSSLSYYLLEKNSVTLGKWLNRHYTAWIQSYQRRKAMPVSAQERDAAPSLR